MGKLGCPLCAFVKPGRTYTDEDLCPEHGAMLAQSAQIAQRHEDSGGCYEGCGCITLEELDRQLLAREIAEAAANAPLPGGGESGQS